MHAGTAAGAAVNGLLASAAFNLATALRFVDTLTTIPLNRVADAIDAAGNRLHQAQLCTDQTRRNR